MNTPSPLRAGFQFHLTTLIALILLSGAWIGLNVFSEQDFTGGPLIAGPAPESVPQRLVRRSFGWPFPCLIALYQVPDRVTLDQALAGPFPAQGWRVEALALVLNLLVLSGVLGLVGVVLERRSRARTPRSR